MQRVVVVRVTNGRVCGRHLSASFGVMCNVSLSRVLSLDPWLGPGPIPQLMRSINKMTTEKSKISSPQVQIRLFRVQISPPKSTSEGHLSKCYVICNSLFTLRTIGQLIFNEPPCSHLVSNLSPSLCMYIPQGRAWTDRLVTNSAAMTRLSPLRSQSLVTILRVAPCTHDGHHDDDPSIY